METATRAPGVTAHVLFEMLERRLSNVVFRLGFVPTGPAARQLVSHGHVLVDGRRVDIPSYQLSEGQTVEVGLKMRKNAVLLQSLETARGRSIADWLTLDVDNFKGTIQRLPSRDHISMPVQEQLIVELYSK